MSMHVQVHNGAPPLRHLGEVAFVASYLDHWVATTPDAPATTYLDFDGDRDGHATSLSFVELGRWSRALAARITELTEPGDRVALLAPQSIAYGAGFVATLRSHAVCVPLFAPDLPGQGERLQAVVADCSPSLVLTTADKADLVRDFAVAHGLGSDRVVVIDDYRSGHDALVASYAFPPSVTLDDIAYLQYTSGSTRIPVGVELTHRNLIENALQLRQAYDLEFANATTVSWLPLFHDMGLILGVAAPVAGGMESVLMDPVAFVLKPSRWLQAISGRQNVMTAAPNFAFDYAAKRTRDSVREQLDLSGVIAWINGAEPVLPSTLQRFQERFAEQGVTERSVKPTYGLAEATVFVATTPVAEPATTILVDSAQLQNGIVSTELASDLRPTTLVSCGAAVGQHLAIVDPDTRELLPDGRVGEIWLHGPNIGVGYWQRNEQTEALFNAKLEGHGDLPGDHWLRTEDLGAKLDGRLYVTGRIKDLIIIDGRNVYPHDVELTVEEAHDGIALRRLAAFSIPTDTGEALVVVAERYRHTDVQGQLEEIAAAARRAVSEEHAIALHHFVLVEPDTIARTSSGKIARKATRTAFLDGTLQATPSS